MQHEKFLNIFINVLYTVLHLIVDLMLYNGSEWVVVSIPDFTDAHKADSRNTFCVVSIQSVELASWVSEAIRLISFEVLVFHFHHNLKS